MLSVFTMDRREIMSLKCKMGNRLDVRKTALAIRTVIKHGLREVI